MTQNGVPEISSAEHPFPEPDSLSLPLLADALDHPHDQAGVDGDSIAPGDPGATGAPEAQAAPRAADAPEPKPRWRGWIHAGTFPVAVAAGIVLICLAQGSVAKWAAAVFTVSSMLLFGVSALYHRFNWKPSTKQVFRRLDHANIFLLIAGTYTPIALLALPPEKGVLLLVLVWAGALLGIGFRVFWIGAPRWLYVPLYVLLGWAAVMFVVDIYHANAVAMVLVIVGGLLYTLGSVVYGIKRPNPVPGVFGFHEIFHALTVLAFLCHWTAALLVALDPVFLR
ncbi:MAG: hemolysin III family protein [Leucobacter sp.]